MNENPRSKENYNTIRILDIPTSSDDTISNICKRYGVSKKTYYKWMSRYKQKGIEGLSDISRRPHNIKYKKVMETHIISSLSSKG